VAAVHGRGLPGGLHFNLEWAFQIWLSNRLRLGILWLKAIILLVAKYEINMAESVCNKERSLLCFEGLDVGLD
jgi:hypothetical protein